MKITTQPTDYKIKKNKTTEAYNVLIKIRNKWYALIRYSVTSGEQVQYLYHAEKPWIDLGFQNYKSAIDFLTDFSKTLPMLPEPQKSTFKRLFSSKDKV